MSKDLSFRFLDGGLNQRFITLLRKAAVKHVVEKDGVVRFSASDEQRVENDLICTVRNSVFPSWQVLTCPSDWTTVYKEYMNRHSIPYREELSNGDVWFLIPRKHRPHLWKLSDPASARAAGQETRRRAKTLVQRGVA